MCIGLIIIASLATVVGVLVEVLVLNAEGWLFELRHCSMVMHAEYRSIFTPLICNGDVSIRVKYSRVGRKTSNKPTDYQLV